MPALFITGTDTGVGKTALARGLVSLLRSRGRRVVALKPVETGCEERDGHLVPADATALWSAQGGTGPIPEWLCRARYRTPASPEAAARLDGMPGVDIGALRDDWRRGTAGAEVALMEGAGGLLVPLTRTHLVCDFVSELQLPVVVVGRAGLGTVNHTLLTAEAARARGLEVLGFVLNGWSTPEEREFARDNAHAIEHHGRLACVGLLPWIPSLSDGTLGDAVGASLDLRRLGL